MPYFRCPYCKRKSRLPLAEFFHGGAVCQDCRRGVARARPGRKLSRYEFAVLLPLLLALAFTALRLVAAALRHGP